MKTHVNWVFFFAAILYSCFHAGFIIWQATHGDATLFNTVYQHFGAIMVLPFAGYAALGLVLLLESRSRQPIEFRALGFEFKGASGPIVLWVLCFVAMALCIKLLW